MRCVALLVIVVNAGCLRAAAYRCASDLECVEGSVQGRCEAVGFCSFPDATCTTGQRFGGASGDHGAQCVGDGGPDGGTGVADGGTDGGVTDSGVPDGLGCPAGYAPLSGIPDRVYRRLPTAAPWPNQVAACGGEGANVYLAIPDDAAELAAIVALAATIVWLGISDTIVEGTFVTVLDEVPAHLPWAPGEPDNSGNQDCVETATTQEIAAERCTTQRIAVCECEP